MNSLIEFLNGVAATWWPVQLRQFPQWQASTCRRGPDTSNFTAPHRQLPFTLAIPCPPSALTGRAVDLRTG